ncbi:MAG: sodium:proton antiporter [Oscillibacter sp.]|nr:sodium:proton antiporter [Oscillibacter sp.]
MGFIRNFPLFTIIFSLFSSVLCMMLTGRRAQRYTVCYECFLIALTGAVLWYVCKTGEAFTYVMGEFPAPWGNEIRAGVLEAMLALVFLIILLCSVLGGWRFLLIDVEHSKINLYFTLINLLTAALMSLVWTNDIFTGYVFLEILTLTSCGILIVREIGRTTLAAVRYMVLNLLGSGLFLLGVVLLYSLTGHLLMLPMRAAVSEIVAAPGGAVTVTFSLAILTIGLGIKSGLFPFHFWMPDTYGTATPTSAAILSALVSKAYIFLLFKIYWRVIGIEVFETLPIRRILFGLGILGMVFGSVSAIRADSIHKMVAFSSAAQIGYIYMGLGMGGPLGYVTAIFQILAHAVTKSLLFLTTPRLARVSGDSLLFQNLQGSGLRDKSAGIFFTLCAFSMVGIPVFAGFSAKLFFAVAAVETGDLGILFPTMLALAVSSVLNALYFIRTVIRIYTAGRGGADIYAPRIYAAEHNDDDTPDSFPETETLSGRLSYWIPALALTGMNLFLGLFSWVALDFIRRGLAMFA